MQDSVTIKHQVQFCETDMAGIVHFSNFFRWMETAELAFFDQTHIPLINSSKEGTICWPRVHASCNYENPVMFRDTVEINISLEEVSTHALHFEFHFFKINADRSKTQVAQGKMVTVCGHIDPISKQIKKIPIAETFFSKFKTASPKVVNNPAKEY